MTTQFSASEMRVLRFLKTGACEMQDSVRDTHMLLVGEQGSIAVARSEITAMCGKGLLQIDGQKLALSGKGRGSAKSIRKASHEPARITASVEMAPGETVEVNLAESPLAMLYRRKGADGNAFISEDEFHAGERLRADFTRGSLMPSITSRWDIGVGGGGRGGAGGMAELTDIALASRMRVERALEAVGPELNGVLVDVCCFLKGLERVERERQWPVRSGKVVLKTALAMLHRHYNPPRESDRRRGVVLHWGVDGYRPAARPQMR
ncbi:DUF6456 domain-containing protein [Brucella haematophila]|uniref:DUF6456 domain-containing protein n=1 Tax=Brucella haematophila TaxID=419474 RepID=UPI00110D9048|nr:DUF6456 domain-containing protein [Brucella haematophila]TMV01488.1 hypothetical protein FGI60_13930 [Brucella haematophila]